MQKKSVVVAAVLGLVLVLGASAAFAGGAGCNKAAHSASHGTPCGQSASQTADGKPCCSRMAMDQAVVALKTAAEASGSAEAIQAVQAAEVAVKKAQETTGCVRSKAEAEEAAMAALKNAAELAGSPKAKSAVDAVLVAYNDEHDAEAQPVEH